MSGAGCTGCRYPGRRSFGLAARVCVLALALFAPWGAGAAAQNAAAGRPTVDPKPALGQQPRDQTPEDLLVSLDTDGDKGITALEWTEPTRMSFKRLDKNRNGFVEEGEFMGWRAPGADKYMTKDAFERRRKIFSQTDFDQDRRLSEEEFLFKAVLAFRNLDRDRDGKLSLAELSAGHSIARAIQRNR